MKKNIRTFLLFTFSFIFIFANSFPALASSDKSAEIDKYIEMLGSASLRTRIDAAKLITRSGITDPRLYNIINDKLLNKYDLKSLNSDHIDEMSWMCKALTASGSENYAPTLEKIIQTATSDKLKRYAKQSLFLISEYAERNKLLSDTANSDPSLSPEINKYIHMLRSDNLALKTDAAKSIYRNHFSEKKLFDVLRDELLKGYKLTSSMDRNYTDTMAWMCKALASSGMAEYKQPLTEIIENSSSLKLQKYAKQSLGMLQ
jgi:hypothetical protein